MPGKPARTSLTINNGEPGDSDGASSRIEIVWIARAVVILKRWGIILTEEEGMGYVRVGVKVVGGSYLIHIIKTWYLLTGNASPSKMSANRSIPLPLLVVHSGKTTIGLSAFLRISSKVDK